MNRIQWSQVVRCGGFFLVAGLLLAGTSRPAAAQAYQEDVEEYCLTNSEDVENCMEGTLVMEMFQSPTGPEIYTYAETWSEYDFDWNWIETYAEYDLYQGSTEVESDYDMESNSSFASVEDVYQMPLGYQYQLWGYHTVLCYDDSGEWYGEVDTYVTLSPEATIAVNFTGSKTLGDNLLFLAIRYECSENLGLTPCTQGWVWNVEVQATVSDDASNWSCQQSVTGSASGYYRDTNNNLQPFSFLISKPMPQDSPGNDVTQQPAGQKTIFWIDGVGRGHSYGGNPIDSMTEIKNYTSQICRTANPSDCYSVSWYLKLVVTPGGVLDTVNTTARYGSL